MVEINCVELGFILLGLGAYYHYIKSLGWFWMQWLISISCFHMDPSSLLMVLVLKTFGQCYQLHIVNIFWTCITGCAVLAIYSSLLEYFVEELAIGSDYIYVSWCSIQYFDVMMHPHFCQYFGAMLDILSVGQADLDGCSQISIPFQSLFNWKPQKTAGESNMRMIFNNWTVTYGSSNSILSQPWGWYSFMWT